MNLVPTKIRWFKMDSEVKIIKLLQLIATVSAPLCITCECIRIFFFPCTPFFPGYFLLSECSDNFKNIDISTHLQFISDGTPSIIFRVFTCGFLFVILISPTGTFCFVCIQIIFIQVCCLRKQLTYFRKSIEKQVRPHLRNYVKHRFCFIKYRELQILVQLFNNIHQNVSIVVIVNFSAYVFVLSMYALVNNGSELSYFQLIILVCIGIDGFVMITVCIGTIGSLYKESVDTKELIYRKLMLAQAPKYNKMWILRYSRSLRPLMIKVGSVIFIDRLTTISLVHLCITTLVNMLLLK